MGVLAREARALQNPALGAILLWGFCREYYDTHPRRSGAPLPLLFLVLPMVLHETLREAILKTQVSSGLRKFVEKLSSSAVGQSDLIISIQERANLTRGLSMDSLELLLQCGLATIDNEATVIPSKPRGLKQQVPEGVAPILKSAEKLGRWASAVSLYEFAVTLKVTF